MIISHQHRFIFLHGRKTAGTSIGISLMRHLGYGDVVRGYITGGLREGVAPPDFRRAWTRIGPVKAMRVLGAVLVGRTPAETFASRRETFHVHSYREYARRRFGVTNTHLTCSEVRDLVGPRTWEDYFTFTFERDPFDRMVSFYYWRTRGLEHPPSFLGFVRAIHYGDSDRMRRYNALGFSNTPYYIHDWRLHRRGFRRSIREPPPRPRNGLRAGRPAVRRLAPHEQVRHSPISGPPPLS